MEDRRDFFQGLADRAISGKDSHVETGTLLEDLDWKLAGVRRDGVPHSLFQLVNHTIYWQEWVVKWLDGKRPRPPKHAAGSWPGRMGPGSRQEWQRTVRRFRKSLDALHRRTRDAEPLSKRGKHTRLEMLLIIGSHNSYHAGQIAFLRQMLGAWPPPSGGVTW